MPMVSALRPFLTTTRDVTAKLYGRYYGTTSHRPVTKAIHTQSNTGGRTPRLDLLMSGNKLQPFIHDAVITVLYRGVETCFHIFVKNHKLLPINTIVTGWNRGAVWRGDIVVMRKGKIDEFVSVRGGDASLIDFVIKRFIQRVRQRPHFYIPRRMVFFKL